MTSQPNMSAQAAFAQKYDAVRRHSVSLCAPLAIEDHVVQPTPDVSPPKWHLAHTTWFFEELLLVQYAQEYQRFDDTFPRLFNSYYKSAGEHWLQAERGQLSRPTVAQVLDYRAHVDRAMSALLQDATLPPEALSHLEIGLHHEQQHQELLLMDIKYILGANPCEPTYLENNRTESAPLRETSNWLPVHAGNYDIGHRDAGFAFDNERPSHTVFLGEAQVRSALVSNREFAAFIEDGGYHNPAHWLSAGWDWVQQNDVSHPLYWSREGDVWREFTLHGSRMLDPGLPVCHVNYFEAQAYAAWSGLRLPTEAELEITLRGISAERSETPRLHPETTAFGDEQLWLWSSSSYAPYPGYSPYRGMLGEYNGKFMCNQYVLRGGCVATPPGHYRASYRNFFQPHQRWQFSGIALARTAQ